MGTEENQRAVFTFLLDHFRSQEPFTKKEMEEHTNWQGQSSRTYWSKTVQATFRARRRR